MPSRNQIMWWREFSAWTNAFQIEFKRKWVIEIEQNIQVKVLWKIPCHNHSFQSSIPFELFMQLLRKFESARLKSSHQIVRMLSAKGNAIHIFQKPDAWHNKGFNYSLGFLAQPNLIKFHFIDIFLLNWSIFIKNRYNFLVRKNDILITVGIRIFKFGMYSWFDIDFYEDCKPTLLEPFQGFNVVFQYIFFVQIEIWFNFHCANFIKFLE